MTLKPRHALAAAIIAAVFLAWFFWDSPERAIRAVLTAGEAAVEAKDIAGAMTHVAREYHDEAGLNYFAVRRLLGSAFARFQVIDVRLYDVRVDVRGEGATARGRLQVLGDKAYLIGTPGAPDQVSIVLVKGAFGWKVTAVNGMDRMRFVR